MEGDGLFAAGDMMAGAGDKKPTKVGLFDNDEDNEEVEQLQKESVLRKGGAPPKKNNRAMDEDEDFKPQEFKPSRALPDKKKKTVLDMLGESDDEGDAFKPDKLRKPPDAK